MTAFVIASQRKGSFTPGAFARAWTLGKTGAAAFRGQTGSC